MSAASELEPARFLSRFLHELRTPVGSLMMLIELIRTDETLDSKTAERVEKLQLTVSEIKHLAQEVDRLNRLETGAQDLLLDEVTLESLIRHMKEVHREEAAAGSKALRFVIVKNAGLPEAIATDLALVRSLLGRLVRSATVATDDGGEIEIRMSGAKNGSILGVDFAVGDGSPALSEALAETLFEPFSSASRSRLHGTRKGSLDLPIARRLAEQLGGQIRQKPRVDGGRWIHLFLPIEIGPQSRINSGCLR